MLFASTSSSIEQLGTAGATVNVTMTDGWAEENGFTALMNRAEALDLASVDLLVTLGADGSILTASGASALDYAVVGNTTVRSAADVTARTDVIGSIARTFPPLSAFSRAMLSTAQIHLLNETVVINPGPPPTESVVYDRFPVSVRPILELLESYGGVPSGIVENGPARRNILMLMLANRAFRYEPYDELSWLCRKYGFSLLDDSDANGEPALFHIFNAASGFPRFMPELIRLVRLFISYSANLNYRDNAGATVLHRIVQTACRPKGAVSPHPFPCDANPGSSCALFQQAATLLISAGADPKLTDFSGKTPGRVARDRPNCPFRNLPAFSVLDANGTDTDEVQLDDGGTDTSHEDFGTTDSEVYEASTHIATPLEDHELDALWMQQFAALVAPELLDTVQEEEGPAKEAASEDPEVAQLSAGAAALYRDANRAYQSNVGHVDPYIRINKGNGRRSTLRQAQLYEQYIFFAFYDGPGPFPKADQPGKSKHEYGYAIDVVRSADGRRLSDALSASGWEQSVEDEGWHWVAVAASQYSALVAFIDGEMKTLSNDWALTLSSFYERRKESLALLSELEALRVELLQAQRKADDLRQQLTQESAWLTNEEGRLRSVYNDIGVLDREISQLQTERANKRYTYCPNRQPYANCGHAELKQRFDNELRQLDQSIQSKRVRRGELARDYDIGRKTLVARRQRFAVKQNEWRTQLQQVKRVQVQVSKKRQQVMNKQSEMQAARASSTNQLSAIVENVKRWQ